MTYAQAAAQLPTDAKWSCSFGNPGGGRGGYNEYHRDRQGNRYVISNGTWDSNGETWGITRLLDAPKAA